MHAVTEEQLEEGLVTEETASTNLLSTTVLGAIRLRLRYTTIYYLVNYSLYTIYYMVNYSQYTIYYMVIYSLYTI